MSEHDLPDLPPDVTSLLNEARGVPHAPAAERRRVASRLALSVGLAIPGATLALSRVASRAWIAKALGVALVVVGAAGVTRVATRHEPARSPAPIARRAAPRGQAVVAAPVVAPAVVPGSPVVAEVPSQLARRADTPMAPVVDEDRSFRDELSLLERAHAALTSDDVEGASAALSQHARRFPHGRLEPEREAIRVQCAAARGDREAASAARRRFHQRFPDSVLGASVDRAVDGAQ